MKYIAQTFEEFLNESMNEKVDMEELEFKLKTLKKENPGKKVTYSFIKDAPSGYRFFIDGKVVVNESHPATAWSASLNNTPGMGNVSVSATIGTFADAFDSGTNNALRGLHQDLVIEDDGTDGWMRPSGNYRNRNWLLPNYTQYMNLHQSNARFQIGERVVCIDPDMGSFGQLCKIVAFEDNTIRIEVINSETGVGQTAKQYRCVASCLKKM